MECYSTGLLEPESLRNLYIHSHTYPANVGCDYTASSMTYRTDMPVVEPLAFILTDSLPVVLEVLLMHAINYVQPIPWYPTYPTIYLPPLVDNTVMSPIPDDIDLLWDVEDMPYSGVE